MDITVECDEVKTSSAGRYKVSVELEGVRVSDILEQMRQTDVIEWVVSNINSSDLLGALENDDIAYYVESQA